MGNDLKYGLVLAGVVVVIFMGYVMMRSPDADSRGPETPMAESITTEPDMFAPPQIEPPYESEPQRAIIEFRAGTETPEVVGDAAEDGFDPLVAGFEAGNFPEQVTVEEGAVTTYVEGAVTTYVIKSGDLLSTISKKFYGTTTKWRLIHEANRDIIPDPNVLKVGTEIVIPAVETARVRRPEPRARREGAGTARRHVVIEGDRLWALAETYYGDGNKWKRIHNANKDKIPNPNALKVGIELVIP